MKFTMVLAIAANLVLLPFSAIFRPWGPKDHRMAESQWGVSEFDSEETDFPCEIWETDRGHMDEQTMIDCLISILLPYLKTCASYIAGGYAILILDQAASHKTEALKEWCKKHRVLRVMLPAALTWRFQCVDVAIAARMKAVLYDLWCDWMCNTVVKKKYREKSWNYIAPGKHDVVDWCMKACAKVGNMKKLLQAGCNATYMNLDLDEPMAKFDTYSQLPFGEEDDFNRHDWEGEILNMPDLQKFNLWLSPFNWVADLQNRRLKKKWV